MGVHFGVVQPAAGDGSCATEPGRYGSVVASLTVQELGAVESLLAAALQHGSAHGAAVEKMRSAAESVGRSWCRSWLGYHARVYYAQFNEPPPGAVFSPEWGLSDSILRYTRGDWVQYPETTVRQEISRRAGGTDVREARELSDQLEDTFGDAKATAISTLSTWLGARQDPLVAEYLQEVRNLKVLSASDFVRLEQPRGSLMSRDSLAVTQGIQIPPHVGVVAEMDTIDCPAVVCKSLLKSVRRAGDHIRRIEAAGMATNTKRRVFIGHGHSLAWRDLKDFLSDRLSSGWFANGYRAGPRHHAIQNATSVQVGGRVGEAVTEADSRNRLPRRASRVSCFEATLARSRRRGR